MEELIVQFQKTKTLLEEQGKRFASCEASLHEKDRRINFLKKEKRKLLENALEMKYVMQNFLVVTQRSTAGASAQPAARWPLVSRQSFQSGPLNLVHWLVCSFSSADTIFGVTNSSP